MSKPRGKVKRAVPAESWKIDVCAAASQIEDDMAMIIFDCKVKRSLMKLVPAADVGIPPCLIPEKLHDSEVSMARSFMQRCVVDAIFGVAEQT